MLDLDLKAEAALCQVIIDHLAALELATPGSTSIAAQQCFTSFNDQTAVKEGDHVIVSGLGGAQDGQNTGNERLIFSVQVRSTSFIAADEESGASRARHRRNCGQVFESLKTTTVASDLSAVMADFSVFNSVRFRRGKNVTQNGFFVSELIVDLACAPSDIA